MSEPDKYYWYDDKHTKEELLENLPNCFPNPEAGRCTGCKIQHECIDGWYDDYWHECNPNQ